MPAKPCKNSKIPQERQIQKRHTVQDSEMADVMMSVEPRARSHGQIRFGNPAAGLEPMGFIPR